MLKTTQDALAVIFANSYDNEMTALCEERLMASIPFAARYRLVDFTLSSLVNNGIDNVTIIVRKNYRSLMRHLGAGRPWDLSRKNGGLNIVPPYAEKSVSVYNGRVEALTSILEFLKSQKEEYVFISDSNIVSNFDFRSMLDFHKANNADVTIAYKCEPIPYGFMNLQPTTKTDLYYTLTLDNERIVEIQTNPKEYGPQNLSMNIYLIRRELLIELISKAYAKGDCFFERDVLSHQLDTLHVFGYEYTGYTARIADLVGYFQENMKLLDSRNLDALFAPNPIYTTIRDDNPTRYLNGARAKNCMVADGCVIEGEIENCILFRGVKIGRGTRLKNSLVMQDTVIEGNCNIEYMITDKNVKITAGQEMKGSPSFPIFVPAYKEL